jgi:hypothetical protein
MPSPLSSNAGPDGELEPETGRTAKLAVGSHSPESQKLCNIRDWSQNVVPESVLGTPAALTPEEAMDVGSGGGHEIANDEEVMSKPDGSVYAVGA